MARNQFIEKWAAGKYVADFNPIDLAALVEKPSHVNSSGQDLEWRERIWNAMESLFMSAELHLKSIGFQPIIYDAMRVDKNEPEEPLMAYMDESDRRSAVEPWQQILMFFSRTYSGYTNQWPEYQLTRAQAIAWNRIAEVLQDPHQEEEEDDQDDKDEQEEVVYNTRSHWIKAMPENDRREIMKVKVPKLTQLERAILEFCYSLMDDKYLDMSIECALVTAMAVTGVSPAGGYMSTKEYTGKLAALSKVGRTLLVLRSAIMVREDPEIGFLRCLRETVHKFMLYTQLTPMSFLEQVMDLGKRLH